MGKRLGELTKENTKCMIEVNGQKLIDRMLDQLALLKLSRVVIVVGYQAENLKQHIGTRYDSSQSLCNGRNLTIFGCNGVCIRPMHYIVK